MIAGRPGLVTLESPAGGAVFGPRGVEDPHRYLLWRVLSDRLPARRVLFLMLNPSIATHDKPDPTVTSCMGYARAWGFDVLEVCNLYAYRATDPNELDSRDWPEGQGIDVVGPENDSQIIEAAERCEFTVCAWGVNDKRIQWRGPEIVRRLSGLIAWNFKPLDLRALKFTKDGTPSHPLYLSAKAKPISLGAAR